MQPSIDGYNTVDAMPDNLPAVKYPRTPGYRPSGAENPYNAWYVKTSIQGRASRGAERQNRGDERQRHGRGRADDERRLDARGLRAGNRCDDCRARTRRGAGKLSARRTASIFASPAAATPTPPDRCTTRARWAIRPAARPRAARRWWRQGEVDMAIGGDQGGSIRIPAAYCGIYGMKPTHGLVPYTGIMPIEIYVDHTGPMTANVTDNALLLEVIAGPDGYDPRQYQDQNRGLHIAAHQRHRRVDYRRGARRLWPRQLRARCRRQSPRCRTAFAGAGGQSRRGLHSLAHGRRGAVVCPLASRVLTQTMMWGDGYGFSRPDLYVTSLMDFHRGWRQRRRRAVRDHEIIYPVGPLIFASGTARATTARP